MPLTDGNNECLRIYRETSGGVGQLFSPGWEGQEKRGSLCTQTGCKHVRLSYCFGRGESRLKAECCGKDATAILFHRVQNPSQKQEAHRRDPASRNANDNPGPIPSQPDYESA